MHLDAAQTSTLSFLHARLLAGDPVATDRMVSECLRPVERILARRHMALPREAVTDAACDALLAYFRSPERFDPSRGHLLSYLVAIGDFRLRDWLRAQMRRDSREIHVGGTEELALFETNIQRSSYHHDTKVPGNSDSVSPEMEMLVRDILPNERDRRVLALIVDGRTEVDAYAAALGILESPAEERRILVKRHRDRILKRLQRRRAAFDAVRGGDDGG